MHKKWKEAKGFLFIDNFLYVYVGNTRKSTKILNINLASFRDKKCTKVK
jgi:hypothetical protein